MEWLFALCVMIPAAVSDAKYRTISLESCWVAVIAGAIAFAIFAVDADIMDIVIPLAVVGMFAGVLYIGKPMGVGSGDKYFVLGVTLACATISVNAIIFAILFSMFASLVVNVIVCASRPELPFPARLYSFVKRKGDKYCLKNGVELDADESGMRVRPGMPMITFLVTGAIITCAYYTYPWLG